MNQSQSSGPYRGDKYSDAGGKISGFDIERYKHQRQKEPVSVRPRGKTIVRTADKLTRAKPSTINRELPVLSHLFNKAVEWGWMDRRPAKTNRFSEGHGRITYLTVDQVNRLVECAKADGNAQIYPFIVIGLETAMRKSGNCPRTPVLASC